MIDTRVFAVPLYTPTHARPGQHIPHACACTVLAILIKQCSLVKRGAFSGCCKASVVGCAACEEEGATSGGQRHSHRCQHSAGRIQNAQGYGLPVVEGAMQSDSFSPWGGSTSLRSPSLVGGRTTPRAVRVATAVPTQCWVHSECSGAPTASGRGGGEQSNVRPVRCWHNKLSKQCMAPQFLIKE